MAMLEGEISQINLIERLVELWREQFTGAIRFESDGIIKIVYFKNGDILSASTNDRADSVDEILMRAGKVTREHVKQALAKRKENETLGDALLNLGFITRKELTWARRVQVVGVIRSIAQWQTGSFTIVADYLPKRDEGTLFPLPMVLVELIVTDQDRQKFDRALEGGAAVFAKTHEFEEVFRRLGLNDEAERIASQIDGTRSVEDVATASGGETFNVYKLVHALATLGILQRVQTTQQFTLDDFASAGVADAADMWSEPEPEPEVVTQAEPMFQLDEAEALRQPTMEIQLPPVSYEPEPEPAFDDEELPQQAAPTHSAWDDDDEDVATPLAAAPLAATREERMPAWDAPPPAAVAPLPVPIEPPVDADEEPQWGFDEAQIETAARADVPVSKDEPVKPFRAPREERSGSRFGLVIALLVFAIIAGGGYAGYMWWLGKQEAPAAEPVARTTRPPRKKPAQPATTTAADATSTAATSSTAAPSTGATSTLAEVTDTNAPLPVVTRAGGTSAGTTPTGATNSSASATSTAAPLTATGAPSRTAAATTPPGTAPNTPARPAAATTTVPRSTTPARTAGTTPSTTATTAPQRAVAATTTTAPRPSPTTPARSAGTTPSTTAPQRTAAATTTAPRSTTPARTAATTPAATATSAPQRTASNRTTAPSSRPTASTQTPAQTRAPLTVSTPAPNAAVPASSARERYDTLARDFAKNASGNFTVQIQILCDPSNVGKAMKEGGDNVWFVPQTIGSRACYRVFWGRYDTRDEAQQALGSIPKGVRDPNAAVKPVPKG